MDFEAWKPALSTYVQETRTSWDCPTTWTSRELLSSFWCLCVHNHFASCVWLRPYHRVTKSLQEIRPLCLKQKQRKTKDRIKIVRVPLSAPPHFLKLVGPSHFLKAGRLGRLCKLTPFYDFTLKIQCHLQMKHFVNEFPMSLRNSRLLAKFMISFRSF